MRKEHSALRLNTLKDTHNVSLSKGRKDLFERVVEGGRKTLTFLILSKQSEVLDVWGLGLEICKH